MSDGVRPDHEYLNIEDRQYRNQSKQSRGKAERKRDEAVAATKEATVFSLLFSYLKDSM